MMKCPCMLFPYSLHFIVLSILFVTIGGGESRSDSESDKHSSESSSVESQAVVSAKQVQVAPKKPKTELRRKDILPDFHHSSEELAAQQRPKRGYYYYGHPHSPNFFDRYFDRGSNKEQKRIQKSQSYPKRQSLGGRMLNKFRQRTNNLVNAASAVAFAHENYQDGEDAEVPDLETAGAFWNLFSSDGGGGGGSGRGYGHGGGGYGKGVNKSAVGLLGFLSLLSLIQNALTTTTTMAAGRRRRSSAASSEIMEDLPTPVEQEKEVQNQKIADIVLPLLTSFSYAMQDDKTAEQKLKCVLNDVCVSNHALVTEFGEQGKDVGLMLGNVLESMAKKRQQYVVHQNSELLHKLRYAARAGRNKRNCATQYKKCDIE